LVGLGGNAAGAGKVQITVQQLSGLDAAFLGMETRAVNGNVGGVAVLDPSRSAEPLTLHRLTRLVGSRLYLIPAFRRRLVPVPLGLDHPYWIEDPDLDLEYHVRELALPAPGDNRQLTEQVARVHARHLDRSHPLWELYLIQGLATGRIAIYLKMHHAAIDGVSGNDLIAALLDLVPEGRVAEPPPEWAPDTVPGPMELIVRGVISLAVHPLRATRLGWGLFRSAPRLASRRSSPRLQVADRLPGQDKDVVLPTGSRLRAPPTPFNRSVGAHRRCSFCSLSLAEVKAVKDTFGVTVNDVVMALCAGALRRYVTSREALPDMPLVAAVPVSLRTAEDGQAGNKMSIMITPIPTHLTDAQERLRTVHDSMRAAKEVHGALPANLLADVAQFAMPALVGLTARLSARLRLLERLSPFNLVISNVPGPQLRLYCAGARLRAYYPLSAVTDGQGLNMTVISCDGQMHFGLLADRELAPDLDRLAGFLAEEMSALSAAAAALAAGHDGADG
jgi:WS/DGAT/MGAT family acyltransferase